MESDSFPVSLFFFFAGGRKKKDGDGGMLGQHSQALLISFLLCVPASSFFLPPSFPPIYKSINVRGYVLCHCSVFKSLKRGRCLCNWQNWRCAPPSKSLPALKVAHRGEKEREEKKKWKKKKSCIKARDRKAVNKSGYPRMSGDEVSH